MKTRISKTKHRFSCILFIILANTLLQGEPLRFYLTPSASTNSIVLQLNGEILTSFYSVSNSYAPPLERSNLTNLLQAYFVAQQPTNFELYASLFESNSRPENDGVFGAAPNAMWFKGVYRYGNYTLADLRFQYSFNGQQTLHDTLLTMIRAGDAYFLTADFEDPAVCLLDQERSHTNVWNSNALFPATWTGEGYFAVTNYAFKTNASNPWVYWLPGSRLGDALVLGDTPAISSNLMLPENLVSAGIQALISGDQNAYLALVHPDDVYHQSPDWNMTTADCIRTNWNLSRQLISNGVRLSERVNFGETAYVTFRPVVTNGTISSKDWLFLRRFNGEWRLSARHQDDGHFVIGYLLDTCAQLQSSEAKVLPGH